MVPKEFLIVCICLDQVGTSFLPFVVLIFSSQLFFLIDASYVIGITYQTIDKNLISELLGGLQGMFHHCQQINISLTEVFVLRPVNTFCTFFVCLFCRHFTFRVCS